MSEGEALTTLNAKPQTPLPNERTLQEVAIPVGHSLRESQSLRRGKQVDPGCKKGCEGAFEVVRRLKGAKVGLEIPHVALQTLQRIRKQSHCSQALAVRMLKFRAAKGGG